MSASKQDPNPARHGRQHCYVKGEGWITEPLFSIDVLFRLFGKLLNWVTGGKDVDPDSSAYPDPAKPGPERPELPTRRFCRLFEAGPVQDEEALIQLGQAIEDEEHGAGPAFDSQVPAGYTYLGQFIDHDITAQNLDLDSQPAIVEDIPNGRTPALDLDSVYGAGPASDTLGLYEADGVHMRIGETVPTLANEPGGPIAGGFPNDLPRNGTSAIIGDPRNDENLAVAQTHLAFLKFHNVVADEVKGEQPDITGDAWFQETRTRVVRRYQRIVLTDYLPRVVDNDILADVIQNGPSFYDEEKGDCMPVEFAGAAFRMGHSMIRPSYEWNKVFNSNTIPATLSLLFEFSGVSGTRGPNDPPFLGKPALPSNWIIDWNRFYEIPGNQAAPQPARKLDARMALDLKTLPEFQQAQNVPPVFLSLATRNLARGRQLRLPTGQQVAAALTAAGIPTDALTPAEVADSPQQAIVQGAGFDRETPLWYYVLRESMTESGGERLGKVGSRILSEFFVGAIQRSQDSVLDGTPVQPFTMPDLLLAVGELNPLGA